MKGSGEIEYVNTFSEFRLLASIIVVIKPDIYCRVLLIKYSER